MATKKKAAPQRAYSIQDLIDEGIAYTPESTEPTAAAEPDKRTWGQAIGDTAVQFGQGAVTGVKMMSDIFGANNAVSSGLSDVNQALDGLLSATAQGDKQKVAQIMQEAEGKGWGEQIVAGLKAAGVDPVGLAANALGTSLPTMATMLIPGAGPAAVAARMGAGVAMGAGQGVGAVKGQIYDETKRKWLESGATPDQAEARAQEASAYRGENTDQMAIGGVLGMGSVLGAERALGKVLHGATKAGPGMLGRVATSTLAETGTEMLQGGQEKFATNTALNRQGFDVDPMSGVIANATLEGAAAAPMGAVAGIPRPAVVAATAVDPAQAAADAIRATEKVPESGALTKAVNAGVEAKAQAVEAGGLELAPLVDGAAPEAVTPNGLELVPRPGEQAPEPVDDPVRDQILALPDGARQDALRAYAVVNRTDVAKGVQQYNRKLLDRLLAENQPAPEAAPEVGGIVRNFDPKSQPTNTLSLAPMGEAAYDNGIDFQANAQSELARRNAELDDLTRRAPRTSTAPVDLSLPTDPVQNYLDNLRGVNTPAARAYVRDFDAGRITPADVQRRMQAEQGLTPEQRIARAAAEAPAQTDPVADRLRQAVSQRATPAPTDILNPAGKPFKTRMAADRAAKKTPGAVVPVEGGFVVRPQESVNVQDVPQAPQVPQAAPAISQPGQATQAVGAQPTGPATGVPAEGAGAVEAAGLNRPKSMRKAAEFDARKAAEIEAGALGVQEAEDAGVPTQVTWPAHRRWVYSQAPRMTLQEFHMALKGRHGMSGPEIEAYYKSKNGGAEVSAAKITTEGAANVPQASQAQQASPQPTQAAAAPAAAAGLTDGAPTANTGAQAAPAGGTQGAAQAAQTGVAPRPKNWRTSMLGAGPVAKAMGIDTKGKRLAQVVAEIDARDTQAPATPAPAPALGPTRLGRNNTPLNEGGKPFKTRKAAGDAKKLQPMMRVVTVPGGYALAEKTPAQLAAEERASRRLRNPNTSARGEPIPAHAFIAAAGGLNRVAASDMGVDGNPRIGNRTLFAGQGRGLSMDQATQMLIQDGYLSEGATINDALALIKKSLTQPQYNADGIERIAQAESDAQFEDYLAAQEEAAADGDTDPFGMADEFTAEELDEVGYTDADPALQAEVSALIAQAEAAGIDTYGVLDDIVRTYANATQDQYNAAARDALAQAIARGNQDGGSTAAQAAPAAEPAAEQGLNQPEAPANQAQVATENVAQTVSTTVEMPPTRQQESSPFARFATGRYRIAIRDEGNGQYAEVVAIQRGSGVEIEMRMPGEALEHPAFSQLNARVQALFETPTASMFDAEPPALELAAQTPAEAAARQDAQEQADKAEAAAKRAEDAAAKAEEERKRIAQASVRAADRFELGQDPMDSLTGQGSVFDAQEPEQQAPTAQPITRADVTAAQQQAAAIITERIDAMTAGEVNTIARRFLPTMGVKPTVSKERNKAAVTDFTKVNPLAAADEFGATLPADVRRVLQADMEGRIAGPAATAPKSTAKPAATATNSTPIEDAGEKIGGARKDRWKERGLNLDDLDAMTEAEGAELATKANVWKPDYEALAAQSEPVTAAMVKTIYDQLAAKPKQNTPEGRRQYVQMMRIVRDVLTEAKGPDAVRNAYLEIRKRAGLNTMDPQAKAAARELLFSVYKGRSDPFVMNGADLMKVKKMVDDGFPAKAAPWKTRLTVGRREGGSGTTERGVEMYMELSAEAGTPLTREQILGGFYRVSTKDNKTVAFVATKEDAEAAAATVYERDMKGKKDGKPEPVRPNLDELKRENLPQRIDRDVTSEDFVRDLGFRGVEFGNWSAQDERQRILNMAYDGLMDLAEIMGVPPKAMSLNGTLGMAFGARGGGRFAAHYEPGKLVINMTKIRGGGSMAHEWAHAMDHYFGELDKADAYTTQARGASGWHTEEQYKGLPRKRMERVGNEWKSVEKMRLDNLRPEMAAAFDEVMRALFQKQITKAEMVRSHELDLERTEALAAKEQDADMKAVYTNMAENKRQALDELRQDPEDRMYDGRGRSDYASQAQELSGKSENGYWTRPTEMFARAFESWVFDKVTAMGARSDYLVHGVEEDRFAGGGYKGNPYPTGEERARINAAFDKLAQTIKTKETDKGVAMFRSIRTAKSAQTKLSQDAVEKAVASALNRVVGAPKVQVVAAPADAGIDVPPGVIPKGVTLPDGSVLIFSDSAESVLDVFQTVFHELYHRGSKVRFTSNPDYITKMLEIASKDELVQQEVNAWKNTADSKDKWAEFQERGPMTGERLANFEALAVEEALATMAEKVAMGEVRKPETVIKQMARFIAKVANAWGMNRFALWLNTRSLAESEKFIIETIGMSGGKANEFTNSVLFRSKAEDISARVGDTLKSITVTNIKQRAGFKLTDYLGIGLQALGRRQIVDIYGDLVPLAEYNRLVQQMEADKNEGGAEADQLVTRWAKLQDEAKLADLMHDATLAQIDPDKDYVDGDDKGKFLMLERKFTLLSDEAKAVYRDTRDAYKAHHAKVRSAIKERIERSEIKGERKAALLKQMDDEFFKAVKGVYFPLARFGQYAVTVKGPDGKVESVSRAETKAEAEALRNNLLTAFPRDKGFTVGRVMLSKDFIADRDAVGRGFMTELYQVLDKQDMDAAQRAELEDTLGQLYLSSLPDLSWAKHGIHRKGTPGFSQDARRAFAQNMFHGARYLAKLRYSDLMQDELAAMQKHVDDWREVEDFDQNSAQRVVDEMNKRHESLMNPKSNALSTALTSLGFVFHLGLSPASAMVNLSQTALVAYPIMGAKWGFGKASAALLKASAEAAKGKNDITASLNEDERAAYDEAVRAGTIDVTMAHDLAGIAQGEDAGVMWKIRPVMRWASFLFHHAERFNRQVTFVAAYRLAREAGADHKAAFEQATKATYDGHFDYGAANRPRIMQGNVAKVLLLFKQYGQNMVYTLARNAQQAIKGESPEVRAQARKALGGLLATHAAAAGVLGLPMVTTLLAAASMIGGDDDEPWDAKVALQNMLADTFGQKPAEVLAHGLSRLTPWDISGRVGLDKLIFPDVQEGLEGQRLWESAATQALGPVGGIFGGALKGLDLISDGHYQLGLEAMLPAVLRQGVKSIRYATEGAQDKTGVVIKDEVSLAGVAGQLLGFSPSEVRLAQEGKSAIYQQDKALAGRRQELLTKAARATMAKDAEARAEAMKEIQRFNEKNPTRRITPLNVLQSVRNRQKRIDQAEGGVYLPKNRRDAIQAGRFALAESE